MRSKISLNILIVLFFVSCDSGDEPKVSESNDYNSHSSPQFSVSVQKAHSFKKFRELKTVSFDLQLFFGGKERLLGEINLLTDGTKGEYKLSNGERIFFSQDSVYINSKYSNPGRARFAAYTWSYFFLMPYKLNDPGTIWENYNDSTLNGDTFKTGKLSFKAGTGDAPDDWYIVYADPESMLMKTAAYIVTAGKSQDEAEKDPHAIQYSQYKEINEIPMAHRWDFYSWRKDSGLTDTLGYAILKNIQFGAFDESDLKFDESMKLVKE